MDLIGPPNPNFIIPPGQFAAGVTGAVLNTVYNETTSFITNTSTMAGGVNTIPIKTDGAQILSVSITPKATTNTLLITSFVPIGSFVAANLLMALFQDSVTAALAAVPIGVTNSSFMQNIALTYSTTAGTTGPTTFKINVSNFNPVVSSWVVNGVPTTQLLGGASRATLVVQELHG